MPYDMLWGQCQLFIHTLFPVSALLLPDISLYAFKRGLLALLPSLYGLHLLNYIIYQFLFIFQNSTCRLHHYNCFLSRRVIIFPASSFLSGFARFLLILSFLIMLNNRWIPFQLFHHNYFTSPFAFHIIIAILFIITMIISLFTWLWNHIS